MDGEDDTMLDEVEQCFLELFNEPEFKKLRLDESHDMVIAAQMVQQKAIEKGRDQAAESDLYLLHLTLKRVRLRYEAKILGPKRRSAASILGMVSYLRGELDDELLKPWSLEHRLALMRMLMPEMVAMLTSIANLTNHRPGDKE